MSVMSVKTGSRAKTHRLSREPYDCLMSGRHGVLLTFGAAACAALTRANLSRADLKHANLSYANLTLANLARADLSGAVLMGARFCNTTMPDGSQNNSDCER